MALELIIGMLAQSIDVEVRHRNNGRPIGSAQVVMEGGSPPLQRRSTRSDGRTRFAVVCSEEIKFWAELPDDPSFPRPSAPVSCQPPLVTLKLRPGN